MYFEDLEEKQLFSSRKRVVTGTDIDVFATMTGAVNPLFLRRDYAVSAGMRDRVAPGILTIALLFGSLYQLGLFDHIVALAGIDKLRFLLPVCPGDILESKAVVEAKKETRKLNRGVVILHVSCTNQEGAKVLEGELTFLFLRKTNPAGRSN
jgi:3-hydroxybutyryl-CoA dehydratase